MRAKFVLEKFVEDSDPIIDMGIGMLGQIKDWLQKEKKGNRIWHMPDINDTKDLLDLLISVQAPIKFIDYILKTRDDYNKNYIINRLPLETKNIPLIDYLLEKGAKFEHLSYKVRYIKEFKGTATSLTPTDELTIAVNIGDYQTAIDLIQKGVKLTMGMINSLIGKIDYQWYGFNKKIKDRSADILQYIRDNVDDLENIIHPKDLKKIDKIKSLLQVNLKSADTRYKYPNGYKIYRVLKFIKDNVPESRKDIVKFIVELTYGKNTFNPITDGSYWSDAFASIIYPRLDRKTIDHTGKHVLNANGVADLQKMEAKFGSMKIDSPV
jgi:hypothetical protein